MRAVRRPHFGLVSGRGAWFKLRESAKAEMAGTCVFVVAGSDDLRVKEEATALARRMTPQGEWGIEVVDGWLDGPEQIAGAVFQVIEAIRTPPFLAGEKLVWFKNLTLPAEEEGKGRKVPVEAIEALEGLVEAVRAGMAPKVRLLISAAGLDRRRAFFKALEAVADVKVCDLPVTTGRRGADAAGAMASVAFQTTGKRADPRAVTRLADLCGPDPRQLRVEAEKAALYAGDAPCVTIEHVDEVVTPAREESLWGCCDAVVEGDAVKAVRMLRQLEFQQENPVGLVAALSTHARQLVQCRILLDCGWLTLRGSNASWAPEAEEVLAQGRDGRLPPAFRISRVAGQAERRSKPHWMAFLDLVFEAYGAMFASGLSDFRALEMLAIKSAELWQRPASQQRAARR